MKDWKELSLREKAAYIKSGVKNGLTSVNDIRGAYNSFAEGGEVDRQKYIDDINSWAISNPKRIFGDDFQQQRQYLNNTTWQELYKSNPELFDESNRKMIPHEMQKEMLKKSIYEGQDKFMDIAKPVASVILPPVGTAFAAMDLTNAVFNKNLSSEDRRGAYINAGLEALPFALDAIAKPTIRLGKGAVDKFLSKNKNVHDYLYRNKGKLSKNARRLENTEELSSVPGDLKPNEVQKQWVEIPQLLPQKTASQSNPSRTSKLSENERLGKTKWERNNKFTVNEGSSSAVDTYLINKSNNPYIFENGKLVWNNKDGVRSSVHFTTDQPVISHYSGNWDGNSELLLTPYKGVVENNGQPLSINPMDTFFANPNNFVIPEKGSKIITSDKANYLKYKLAGKDNVHFLQEGQEYSDRIKNFLKKYKDTGTSPSSMDQGYQQYMKDGEELDNLFRKYITDNVKKPNFSTYRKMGIESGLKNPIDEFRSFGYDTYPTAHESNFIYGKGKPGISQDAIDDNISFDNNLNRVLKYRLSNKELDTHIKDLNKYHSLQNSRLEDAFSIVNSKNDYYSSIDRTNDIEYYLDMSRQFDKRNRMIDFLNKKDNYPAKYTMKFKDGGYLRKINNNE